MEKLPESIANYLWPGCTASTETTESDHQGFRFRVVFRISLSHPDSPITIIFTDSDGLVNIIASGLYHASNRDVRRVLPVLTRLRSFVGKKPVRFAYDEAFKQIESGEDFAKVRKEFMTDRGGSADAFKQAMYRRRKEEEGNV